MMEHSKSTSPIKNFQLFQKSFIIFTLLIIFMSDLNRVICDEGPMITSKVSSVEKNSEITFTWENVSKEDYDPRIVFWETTTFPSERNYTLFEKTGWKFLSDQSKYKKSTVQSIGKINLIAPQKDSLYSIYYCADNCLDGFYCRYQRQIAVITCFNNIHATGYKPSSNVEHIIVFISENHSFDSIYGNYCKAETFSNPICNYGPECCEEIPKELNGFKPKILNDIQNSRFDPCHSKACEESKLMEGKWINI